ncbi:MAG: hypothetical protein LC650_00305 [Actinobacteria bacterium]|nr:hypothetical protein [Actinomycetota bacterium]
MDRNTWLCKMNPADNITLVTYTTGDVQIVVSEGSIEAAVELGPKALHEVADFIKENVPTPPPFQRGDFVEFKDADGGTRHGLFIKVTPNGMYQIKTVSDPVFLPPYKVRPAVRTKKDNA